jgi:hypothetical protein
LRLSQWLRGLRHEPPSAARTMGSLVRIPLEAWMFCLRLFCVCVVLCVGNGLATGWSPVQGFLQTVYRTKKLKKRTKIQKAVEPQRKINGNCCWPPPAFLVSDTAGPPMAHILLSHYSLTHPAVWNHPSFYYRNRRHETHVFFSIV